MKLALTTFLTLLLFFQFSPSVQACSCLKPTLKGTYFASSTKYVIRATPIAVFTVGSSRFYALRVQTLFKGCLKHSTLIIKTSISSASCGVYLQIGQSYLLPLKAGFPPTIHLCDVSFDPIRYSNTLSSILCFLFLCLRTY